MYSAGSAWRRAAVLLAEPQVAAAFHDAAETVRLDDAPPAISESSFSPAAIQHLAGSGLVERGRCGCPSGCGGSGSRWPRDACVRGPSSAHSHAHGTSGDPAPPGEKRPQHLGSGGASRGVVGVRGMSKRARYSTTAGNVERGNIGNRREASGCAGHDLVVRLVLSEAFLRLSATGLHASDPHAHARFAPPRED